VLVLFLLSLALIALVMLAMSVGVVLSGRCLRGSCGGSQAVAQDGEPLACASCPNRERERQPLSRARAA
jgi:hypothetical protein